MTKTRKTAVEAAKAYHRCITKKSSRPKPLAGFDIELRRRTGSRRLRHKFKCYDEDELGVQASLQMT